MENIQYAGKKIVEDSADLSRRIALWNFKNYKIVFTNGCFDIVHKGHLEYLMKAKEQGDILVVGLNSDSSVRSIKGPGRPVKEQDTRALLLASLSFVNAVVIFDEDTPYELIKKVQPDVLVKGGDYSPEKIVGHDVVTGKGGQVVTIDYIQGHSTTALISKILH